jgi:hypothetical protein
MEIKDTDLEIPKDTDKAIARCGPKSFRPIILKGLFQAAAIFALLFIMVWINLNWRSANKIKDYQELLAQKKERLAYETVAEVISMHYSPFSPYVKKAFNILASRGDKYAKQGDAKKAVWAYSLAVNSFPPLFYTPYRSLRLKLKAKAADLRAQSPSVSGSGQ